MSARSAANVTLDGALHAFIDTDLDLYISGGEGLRNYAALGARIAGTHEGAEVLDTNFDRVVLRLIDLLRKALPDCPQEDFFWGYHFVSAALVLTFGRTGRIDKLSSGLCSSDDFAGRQSPNGHVYGRRIHRNLPSSGRLKETAFSHLNEKIMQEMCGFVVEG